MPIRSDKMIKNENHAGEQRDTECKKSIQKLLDKKRKMKWMRCKQKQTGHKDFFHGAKGLFYESNYTNVLYKGEKEMNHQIAHLTNGM